MAKTSQHHPGVPASLARRYLNGAWQFPPGLGLRQSSGALETAVKSPEVLRTANWLRHCTIGVVQTPFDWQKKTPDAGHPALPFRATTNHNTLNTLQQINQNGRTRQAVPFPGGYQESTHAGLETNRHIDRDTVLEDVVRRCDSMFVCEA